MRLGDESFSGQVIQHFKRNLVSLQRIIEVACHFGFWSEQAKILNAGTPGVVGERVFAVDVKCEPVNSLLIQRVRVVMPEPSDNSVMPLFSVHSPNIIPDMVFG